MTGRTTQEDLDFIPIKIIKGLHGRQTFFILVKDESHVEIYPRDIKGVTELTNGLALYWIHGSEIKGYSIFNNKLVPSWNFKFGADESIVKTANWAYDHEESSFSHVIPEEMKVIYKFVDSNNFAVLTKSSAVKRKIFFKF